MGRKYAIVLRQALENPGLFILVVPLSGITDIQWAAIPCVLPIVQSVGHHFSICWQSCRGKTHPSHQGLTKNLETGGLKLRIYEIFGVKSLLPNLQEESYQPYILIYSKTKFSSLHHLMYLLYCMSETFEIFPWTQEIQKILLNTFGCHFAKSLVFGGQMTPWLLAG